MPSNRMEMVPICRCRITCQECAESAKLYECDTDDHLPVESLSIQCTYLFWYWPWRDRRHGV